MSAAGPLEIRTFTSADWGQNAYLVLGRNGGIVAIDPGGEAEAMSRAILSADAPLDAVLLTHAHIDHIEGVARLVKLTGAPVYLHSADRPLYDRAAEQAAYFGVHFDTPPPVDHAFEPGTTVRFGSIAFEVRYVPGHSPGHVMLYAADAGVAFIGDVVFMGSIGRTDLPGGNYRQLMDSIREHVLSLPDETVLYSGHGPATTVGHERTTNPFLLPHYGGGLA